MMSLRQSQRICIHKGTDWTHIRTEGREQWVGHDKRFPREAPWSERLIDVTREQSTIPDSTANPDRLDSGIQRTALVPVPVPRLPVLPMEEQTSVVIPIVIVMAPGTRGTLSHRRTDQRLISCGWAKCPYRWQPQGWVLQQWHRTPPPPESRRWWLFWGLWTHLTLPCEVKDCWLMERGCSARRLRLSSSQAGLARQADHIDPHWTDRPPRWE